MTISASPSGAPRHGIFVCRSCSALPSDDVVMGGRCPWCRGRLSREFGVVVARCVECGTRGVVGIELGSRTYEKAAFRVPRAVCVGHLEDGLDSGGGPTAGHGAAAAGTAAH